MNRFLKVIVAPPAMRFRAIGLRWLMAWRCRYRGRAVRDIVQVCDGR